MNKDNFKVDFIGIGAAKSATSWIAQCLREHPQVCVSIPKEVNFFNKEYGKLKKNAEYNYLKGLNWYKEHFNHCKENQIKGEFSVQYIFDKDTPYLIKKHFPDTKILCSLRNPAERAFSQYQHAIGRYGKIYKSFEEAIRENPEFIERGYYFKQLKPYYSLFPKNNILVIIYDDIKKNPRRSIQKIYKFLGVNSSFTPPTVSKKDNVTQLQWGLGIRFIRRSYPKIMKHPLGKQISKIAKRIKIKKIAELTDVLIYHLHSAPKINTKTKNYLLNIYKEDIKSLEKLINKDLSLWK